MKFNFPLFLFFFLFPKKGQGRNWVLNYTYIKKALKVVLSAEEEEDEEVEDEDDDEEKASDSAQISEMKRKRGAASSVSSSTKVRSTSVVKPRARQQHVKKPRLQALVSTADSCDATLRSIQALLRSKGQVLCMTARASKVCCLICLYN
jgi:hypothetical protein